MKTSIKHQQDALEIDVIQYLRAVAAIMVVYYHALNYTKSSYWPKFGSEGVDVFFVISGFIMAYTTSRLSHSVALWRDSVDFFWRRIIRVVPLYWVALTLACRKELLSGQWDSSIIQDYLFIPHYHTTRSDMIWPHLVPGWTINYEMAFYFLFAMTMLAGKYKRLAMLGALCLTVLLGQFLVNSSGTAATTFYTSPLILEFGFGIALFSINNSWSFRAPAWMWWILAGVSGAMLLLPNTIHRAFADGIPALVLLFSLIQIKSGVKSKILHFLGDASYSIYLFHLFGLELIEKIIRSLSPVLPVDSLSSPLLVIRLVVAVAIGGMIHVMLEKPLTQALKSASLWKPQHRGHNPASSVSGVVPLTNSVVSGQLAASIAQTTLRPSGFSIRDFTNLEMPVHHDFGSGTNPVRLPARLLRVPQRAVV